MVSVLMKTKGIHAVVVGADRVVANGDTANKIGTYQIAIAGKCTVQLHDNDVVVVKPTHLCQLVMPF